MLARLEAGCRRDGGDLASEDCFSVSAAVVIFMAEQLLTAD